MLTTSVFQFKNPAQQTMIIFLAICVKTDCRQSHVYTSKKHNAVSLVSVKKIFDIYRVLQTNHWRIIRQDPINSQHTPTVQNQVVSNI